MLCSQPAVSPSPWCLLAFAPVFLFFSSTGCHRKATLLVGKGPLYPRYRDAPPPPPPPTTPQSSNPWLMPPSPVWLRGIPVQARIPRLTKPAVAPERRRLTSWHARHGIRRHGAVTRHAHGLSSRYGTYGACS